MMCCAIPSYSHTAIVCRCCAALINSMKAIKKIEIQSLAYSYELISINTWLFKYSIHILLRNTYFPAEFRFRHTNVIKSLLNAQTDVNSFYFHNSFDLYKSFIS